MAATAWAGKISRATPVLYSRSSVSAGLSQACILPSRCATSQPAPASIPHLSWSLQLFLSAEGSCSSPVRGAGQGPAAVSHSLGQGQQREGKRLFSAVPFPSLPSSGFGRGPGAHCYFQGCHAMQLRGVGVEIYHLDHPVLSPTFSSPLMLFAGYSPGCLIFPLPSPQHLPCAVFCREGCPSPLAVHCVMAGCGRDTPC